MTLEFPHANSLVVVQVVNSVRIDRFKRRAVDQAGLKKRFAVFEQPHVGFDFGPFLQSLRPGSGNIARLELLTGPPAAWPQTPVNWVESRKLGPQIQPKPRSIVL